MSDKPKPADVLTELVRTRMRLFHSQYNLPCARAGNDRRLETFEIGSEGFALLLTSIYLDELNSTISRSQLDTAVRHLAAMAIHSGVMIPVFYRIAPMSGGIAIDCGDPTWRALVVTVDGWKCAVSPVPFIRNPAMKPLPAPTQTGPEDVELFRQYFPPGNQSDWQLLVVWVVKCFMPGGPYPLLEIIGQQGSAKSFRTRLLVALVDPHLGCLQSLPKSDRDLQIAAHNSHLLAFDNVSLLPNEKSDWFCRMATGGGFRTRKLYSDKAEIIIDACRPVIVNGINKICQQQDLISRAIRITMPAISPEERRAEEEVQRAFDRDHPLILGAFLSLLSGVIRELPNVRLSSMPRMADFARVGVAVERVMGWAEGSFIAAHENNCQQAMESSVEDHPMGQAILTLLDSDNPWKGTASDLLQRLSRLVTSDVRQLPEWPKSENWLSHHLDRLAPGLSVVGVRINRLKNDSGFRKVIVLSRGRRDERDGTPTESVAIPVPCVETPLNVSVFQPPHANHANIAGFRGDDVFRLSDYIIEE